MDKESVATTLIYKNVPKQMDLTALLNSLQIPAKEIKPFGRKRALITYESRNEAETAIEILRELEFAGNTPNVSLFSKENPKDNSEILKKRNVTLKSHKSVQTTKEQHEATPFTTQQISKYVQKLYSIDGDLNFNEPPPPYLKYNYPPINKDILDNICISLWSNKRFYNQVLHLMNRMNLEPPFGERNYKFKLPGKPQEVATQTEEVVIQKTSLPMEKEDIVESELESSEDDEKQKPPQLQIKRKLPPNEERYKKKARQMLQNVKKLNKEISKKPSQPAALLTEMFETSKPHAQISKIEVQLKSIKTSSTNKATTEKPSIDLPQDLSEQKLPLEHLQNLNIYKNYQIGPASNKLYIKNLHKDVTMDDLLTLYKRFLEDNSLKLDIKIMQHGRMKGQAFITFQGSHEKIKPLIAKALEDTNGFILRDKPMVVCYGRQS